MIRVTFALAAGMVAMLAVGDAAARKKAPELTISQIMLKAHQPNRGSREAPDQRVVDGKASAAEKKQLLVLYEALARTKPRAGDLEEWRTRTKGVADSLREAIDGDAKAVEKFAKAVNCKACHAEHRKP